MYSPCAHVPCDCIYDVNHNWAFCTVFNMGTSNPAGMMPIQPQQQQQQHGVQGAFNNMAPNAQTLQANMAALQNSQTHPNFGQQRQPNQQ